MEAVAILPRVDACSCGCGSNVTHVHDGSVRARWRRMVTPPHPLFAPDTLAVVRRLSWSPAEGDIGQLVGGWLALAGSAGEPVLWCAGEQHAPAGIMPRYVARDAFMAMRDGRVIHDGSLVWNGQRFVLADVAEGVRLVARLVAEGVTA
jgi:hypothetical protein